MPGLCGALTSNVLTYSLHVLWASKETGHVSMHTALYEIGAPLLRLQASSKYAYQIQGRPELSYTKCLHPLKSAITTPQCSVIDVNHIHLFLLAFCQISILIPSRSRCPLNSQLMVRSLSLDSGRDMDIDTLTFAFGFPKEWGGVESSKSIASTKETVAHLA